MCSPHLVRIVKDDLEGVFRTRCSERDVQTPMFRTGVLERVFRTGYLAGWKVSLKRSKGQ